MAALSGITAVRPTSDTKTQRVQYGETIAVGQAVYIDGTTGKFKLADNNASALTPGVKGIALTPGADESYGIIATGGSIVLVGTTMAVGETYFVGATAGQIIPDADLATGNYVSRIGTASSTTQISLDIESTGIIHA